MGPTTGIAPINLQCVALGRQQTKQVHFSSLVYVAAVGVTALGYIANDVRFTSIGRDAHCCLQLLHCIIAQ